MEGFSGNTISDVNNILVPRQMLHACVTWIEPLNDTLVKREATSTTSSYGDNSVFSPPYQTGHRSRAYSPFSGEGRRCTFNYRPVMPPYRFKYCRW